MKPLPNIISGARILMVPAVVWLVVIGELRGAFWVFIAAVISGPVDGFIAKRFDAVTEVGVYLDPIVDKALLVRIFVTFGAAGFVSQWLGLLVVSREVLIVGGVLFSFVLLLLVNVRLSILSKVDTSAQMALTVVILAVRGTFWKLGPAVTLETFVVVVFAALPGPEYVWRWWRGVSFEGAKG